MTKLHHEPRHRNRHALCLAVGLCIASVASLPVAAQSTTGAIVGRTEPGVRVTIINPQTGFTRTVTADARGEYRIALLPTGDYTLQLSRDGEPQGAPSQVRVTLGNTTTANVAAGGATNLGTVEVKGSRIVSPVDVTSTESATNVTAEELKRLPVDRNVASVALLAPGVAKGGAGFGGISFGGSSVAENAFYVNGLNVTDFYNRVGFSEAPFDFYKEFQVKTGGYSVEFGRTTGGVVNAIAKSGSNEFKSGATLTFEPRAWQAPARDLYHDGDRYLTKSLDDYSSTKLNGYVSGPIVKDKLFFFAMYEARQYDPRNSDDLGQTLTYGESNNAFWGGTLDWNITDRNTLSLMTFSNRDPLESTVYGYDFDTRRRGPETNRIKTESGGRNWALTYTSNFTDNLSMKLMYGRNDRTSQQSSPLDDACNYVTAGTDVPAAPARLGCTTNDTVYSRDDERKQMRADFEWSLGDHLFRFGADRERNVSDLDSHYPGPGGFQYNVYSTTPGATIPNSGGGRVPAGYTAYVRARRYAIFGNFESTNNAYYLEDNWSVTDNLILNLGVRNEAFDNRDAEGRSYIRMDDMIAPRVGFSWDVKGDSTVKLFGNAGRYFLPVANVINIKQAGALLDERTYYAFDGWQALDYDGAPYALPILGQQFGFYNGQGDGTVGDLRSEVDRDMDPVYQDEFILGFQQQINATWSWGARGIYRMLHNAIDDMEISATAQCGPDGYIGYVMANPGEKVTVWGDTDCDGSADGYLTVDTAKEGWAQYETYDTGQVDAEGNKIYADRYIGQRGWSKPKRDYKALELQVDRAWDDKWSLNASYTLAFSRGNAEGPVNTDTNFADTGRTENFDDPWVNFDGNGPLANDHRHQLKLRGVYALDDHWRVGATLDAKSGGPITGFGVGNPYDNTVYHSYYICTANCTSEVSADRVYTHSSRGGYGRMPWVVDLGASLTFLQDFGTSHLTAKLAFFNLFNRQEPVYLYQDLEDALGSRNQYFGDARFLQQPRYAQLTVSVDF